MGTSFIKAIKNDQVVRALALPRRSVLAFFCRSELIVGKAAGFFRGKRKKEVLNSTSQMKETVRG